MSNQRTSLLFVLVVASLTACPGTAGEIGGPAASPPLSPNPWTPGAPGEEQEAAPLEPNGGDGGTGPVDAGGPAPDVWPTTGPAFLHADVWSTWWNDRTRCGAERAILHICQRRGEADCGLYEQAVAACNPTKIVPGQVGPEKQGERLCQRSKYPDIGGCDATKHDFDKLRFWWYGAEWAGNWPAATIKIFSAGADWKGGGELVALSNVPGAPQAAMSGIANHGLGYGCAMRGKTSGDDKYQKPFGGFAWIQVPTDTPLTVVAAAATNFNDKGFDGCHRGTPSQSPWITGAPGAYLGCIYVLENVVFKPGRQYYWRYGQLVELPRPGPPQELIDGFALPEVGLDIRTKVPCKL